MQFIFLLAEKRKVITFSKDAFVVNTINQYINIRSSIEACFIGLPHASRILANTLIAKANFSTGCVENINYRDLASFLRVDASSGRKDSGTPTKQAVRNYLCTIVAQCGEYFQISSEGQSLKVNFPTLPEIYKAYCGTPEVHTVFDTESNTAEPHMGIGMQVIIDGDFSTEEHTEVHTPGLVEAINAHVKEKPLTNNKQTNPEGVSFAELKQPIRRDFYPNAETIELALSHGYVNVTNPIEIKRFITYNLASSTRWADYNPVFICWLERAHENQKSTEPLSTTQPPRKNADERTPYQVSGIRKPTVADSIADNLRIIESIQRQEQQHQQQADDFINGECCETVAVPC